MNTTNYGKYAEFVLVQARSAGFVSADDERKLLQEGLRHFDVPADTGRWILLGVAAEQEMKARVHEMRARVVEAEAKVPLALADALGSGNFGALDYYNLRNVVADTDMRQALGKGLANDDKKHGKGNKPHGEG